MFSNVILNGDLQQGETFEYPEVVPFRLTHNMVEAMVRLFTRAWKSYIVLLKCVCGTILVFVYVDVCIGYMPQSTTK